MQISRIRGRIGAPRRINALPQASRLRGIGYKLLARTDEYCANFCVGA
jgi:ribosomal protein L30/L7E